MSPTPSSTFAPCSNHDSKDSRDEGSRVPSLRSMTSEEQLAQEARAIDLRRLQKTKDLVDYTILRHTLYAEQVEAAEPSVHRETVQKNEKTIHGDCKFFDPDFQWGIMAGENVGEPGKENSKMSDLRMYLEAKITEDCYKALRDLTNFNKGEGKSDAHEEQTNEYQLYRNYVRAEKKRTEEQQNLQDMSIGETKSGFAAELGDAVTQGK